MDTSGVGTVLETVCTWASRNALLMLGMVGLLLVLVVVLAVRLLTSRRSPRQTNGDAQAGEGTPLRKVEQELEFVFEFIGEMSKLMSELETQAELRRIPRILSTAVLRMFRAEQAVMLVRRRNNMVEPGGGERLIVAAMEAPERGLKVGSEIPLGIGHLGIVAQCQRVLDRRDFEKAHGTDVSNHPVFDVAAPIVANDRTLGVIAFARPHRLHPRAKDILRMVAQLGAMAWTNITTFRSVKAAADIDELTGIFNKRSLRQRLSELVYDAREHDERVSVFIFDLDNFKHYNDTNGHLAGDHLLRALAQLVRETVRSDDVFGRFGGEEFLLLLPKRNGTQAMSAAENIRRRIAEYRFPNAESQPLGRVTVSGGVATFPDDAGDAVELVRAADQALYRAKEAGRNKVCRAATGLNPSWVD